MTNPRVEDALRDHKVYPPWDAATVVNLNGYQTFGKMHPFTCGFDPGGHGVLVAHRNGWDCPDCDYTQFWAFDFMASGELSSQEGYDAMMKIETWEDRPDADEPA